MAANVFTEHVFLSGCSSPPASSESLMIYIEEPENRLFLRYAGRIVQDQDPAFANFLTLDIAPANEVTHFRCLLTISLDVDRLPQ